MSRSSLTRSLILLLLPASSLALVCRSAVAQSLWMPRESDYSVSLEMLRPNIEGVDAKFLSAAFFLSGRAAVSSDLAVVGEIPYVNHKSTQTYVDFNGFEVSEEFSSSTIGDPYVGLETRTESSPIFLELGARVPLASENQGDAVLTGFVTDVVREDAFLPKILSINAAFNLREVTPSRVVYRLRLSPVLAVPTGDNSADTELFGVYSFQIGYQGPYARIGGGMSGRALFTDDSGNLGNRTLNQFEMHADFLQGSIRPGLDLRLPLGSLSDVVPVALGASVSWVR